jgi:Carboxypeptidase regulatory-like domain
MPRQISNRRISLKRSGTRSRWTRTVLGSTVALTLVALFLGMAAPSLASAAGTGQIAGTVTAASGGAPIEGITVCAYDSYGYGTCASTDEHGEYLISGLASGSYAVGFTAFQNFNYAYQFYDGKTFSDEADPVSVTAGSTHSGIDAAMQEGGAISGTVVSASTGEPIRGASACVSEYASFGYFLECASTNENGEYTIVGLEETSYRVSFDVPGESNYLSQYYDSAIYYENATPVSVSLGATQSGIDAELQEGGRISGIVKAASDGRLLEQVEVCAEGDEGSDCAETNEDGEYTITGLISGSYKVKFSPGYESGLNFITQYYNDRASRSEADSVAVSFGETASEIDAEMHEGGRITGTVTKASGGAAIEGVQVCASPASGEYGSSCAPTNAAGQYTIAGLAPGSYKVNFSPGYICGEHGCTTQNYLMQYYNGRSTFEEADAVSVSAEAETPGIDAQMQEGGRITGTVTKASGGAALEGVQVCARTSTYDYGHCATTNSSGEYTISAVPAGTYSVAFSPPYGGNYLTQYYNGKTSFEEADAVSVTAGSTIPGIDAQMHEGGRITGTVTKASGGAALEGVQVCARTSTYDYGHCATTNSSGEYTIAALATGPYKVSFAPGYGSGNYLTQYYNGKSSFEEADAVSVTAGSTTPGIDAQMHEGGRITGTVTKASGGAALEDIEVCARTTAYEYGHCATTNSSGEYTIGSLAPGSYKVNFSPGYICDEHGCSEQNYLTQYYNGKSSFEEADAVSVSAETATPGIDAQMHEGGRITGTVTKASGGAVLEEIDVCARQTNEEYAHCATTNSSGEYTIVALASASYKVEFSPGYICGEHGCTTQNYLMQYYNGKTSFEEADAVSVTAGSTTPGVDAQMHDGGQITGTVTDAAGGTPIEEVEVCASNVSGGEYESHCASTNDSGEYMIAALPTGSYKVNFSPGYVCGEHGCSQQDYVVQYYNGKPGFEEADAVSVTAGSTTPGIDAQMHEGGRITGTVTKASGGAPITGINVCASKVGGGEYEYGYYCATTSTSGQYTISRLPTGSYKVKFLPGSICGEYGCTTQNYFVQYYNGKSTAEEADTISAAVETTTSGIDAQMHEGGQITGTVSKAPGGAVISSISVCALKIGGGEFESHCATTNASGHYAIPALPTASYRVEFSPETVCGEAGCTTQNFLRQYYNGKSSFEEADAVSVTAGSTTPGIDAQMHEGGRITGTVTKASGGAAIRGIEACAYNASGGEWAGCATTNSSGKYTIAALPSGSYKVEFSPGYEVGNYNYLRQYYNGKPSWEEADAVSATAGSTTSGIDAQMHEGGRITGTVTKAPGGTPLEGASVCAYKPGAEEPEGCASTNAAGEYTISALATGAYQVEFRPGWTCVGETCTQANFIRQFYNNKPSREAADLVSVTAGAALEGVDAALQPGGQIGGEVTVAANGDPVSESLVCAYRPGEDEPEACGESNGSGDYIISGLSAGNHIVEFGPGWTCSYEYCSENNYAIQFYNNEESRAAADPVNVTVGEVHEGINAALTERTGGAKPINTVLPHLTGAAALAEELSCSKGTWENSPESFAYAWRRDGSVISGQAGTTYTVQSADLGHSITCVVTATNAAGSTPATSNAVHIPAKPVNTTPPSLSGTPAVGEELSCSNGTWEYSPEFYARAWYRGTIPIGGATGTTYTVQAADQGYNITCEVTATNTDGSTAATSNALAIPAAAGAPVNTTPPSLTGTPALGETLSCSQGIWENSPTSYAYAWKRDGSPISGQSASSYTVQGADAGHGITCEVTATNSTGPGTATSNALQVPPKPVSTASPVLSGTPTIGQTVSCSQGTWENSPTSYEYAWRRDASVISGQVASTYTVQSTDAGHDISCEVTAANGGGSATATSNTLNVPPKPVNTASPVLSGTPAVGSTLSCSHGSWEHNPTSYAYAWKRDGSPISGQTASSYTVQGADAGHGVSCEVTATNGGGSATATSNTVNVPTPTPSSPSPSPSPAPAPTPPPSTPSASAGLGVAGAVATFKGGTVLIPLQCVGSDSCHGIIELIAQITAGRHHKRAHASRTHKSARGVVIGKAKYSLAAGKRATVHVKLTGKGKALLRHAGKRGLKVKLTGTDVKTRMVKLKGSSGGHHHRHGKRAHRRR